MLAALAIETERIQRVPLLDLKAQYVSIEHDIMRVLKEVCASQHFILGAHVAELERRVAAYSRCRFGIGVSSGTDALLVALMALDVGQGDEVITTPYTFFATGGAVARLGAQPLFCDIDPATYNVSPAAIENLIREIGEMRNGQLFNRKTGGRIKVLLPVHLFGQVADMDRLLDISKAYGLKVIEDAAQAIGSESIGGSRAGSTGDIGCFSFFPSKNLGAFGDAGMCTTNDPALAERLRVLRAHGGNPKYYHSVVGGNFRLDEIQAAILLVKLEHLDRWTAERQRNARFYGEAFRSAGLGPYVSTPMVLPGGRHIFNQYVIRVRNRDGLKKSLTDARIGNEVYYPVPLHTQQCFAYLGYTENDCPESIRAARETIAIPIYPELGRDQQQYVVDTIAAFYH
jgi:dTDP-4-amino-4,6-dideoxygalactose transaminase